MLNPEETYYRKKSTLYDSKNIPILIFKHETGNMENLTGDLVENMNTYIRKFPDRIHVIENKNLDEQLTLF